MRRRIRMVNTRLEDFTWWLLINGYLEEGLNGDSVPEGLVTEYLKERRLRWMKTLELNIEGREMSIKWAGDWSDLEKIGVLRMLEFDIESQIQDVRREQRKEDANISRP
jgi:hypothetical protein